MKTFAFFAALMFMISGAVVGARLLKLASRTRQAPELLLGIALFTIAGLGFPLTVVGSTAPQELARLILAIGVAFLCGGWCALWLFTLRVFRENSPVARQLVFGAISLSIGLTLWRIVRLLVVEESLLALPSLDGLGTQLLAMSLYGWTAIEAGRQSIMSRRRVRIGITDPIVANRFLLFALMALFSIPSLGAPIAAAFVRTPESIALARTVTGLSGTVCAVVLYLAFLPPASYLHWIRRKAGASPSNTDQTDLPRRALCTF